MISIGRDVICIIFAHRIVFEPYLTRKMKNKTDTLNMNKIQFPGSVMLKLLKVSRPNKLDLALESKGM